MISIMLQVSKIWLKSSRINFRLTTVPIMTTVITFEMALLILQWNKCGSYVCDFVVEIPGIVAYDLFMFYGEYSFNPTIAPFPSQDCTRGGNYRVTSVYSGSWNYPDKFLGPDCPDNSNFGITRLYLPPTESSESLEFSVSFSFFSCLLYQLKINPEPLVCAGFRHHFERWCRKTTHLTFQG